MAELPEDVLVEFQVRLSKVIAFLQNTLSKESLSSEADEHRKECIILVEGMNDSLNNMKSNNLKEGKLRNTGLSVSSQSLNDTSECNGIYEEGIPRSGSLPDMSIGQSENSEYWQATRTTKSDENVSVNYVNAPAEAAVDNDYAHKALPKLPDLGELPKIPDEADGGQFGDDVYEAVADLQSKAKTDRHGEEEYQDDGFATDEFESGSSDGGDVSPNPKEQPVQQKGKKKKQFFHWLKKKAKKDKLFSSPQDGVSLAGYAYKENDSAKRWFLIREETLNCYKTIKDDDPEMTVDLKGSEIRAGEEEKSRLAIQVIRDGVSHFTLVAKNAKDWERWKKAFVIESGFIKLATSPTELSSGVFEHEDEDDYVCPVISPDLQKKLSTATEKPVIVVQSTDAVQSANPANQEDPYYEVESTIHITNFKPASPATSLQELGPLPPLPPDPPAPRSSDAAEGKEDSDDGDNSWESEEIYEEVSSSVAHADKVIKWDGVNTTKPEGSSSNPASPTSPTTLTGGVQHKPAADKASKGPMPAGVEDGTVEDSSITASSFLDSASQPFSGRLNSTAGAWCPNASDKQQYLQIDLGEVTKVCGVSSQGRPGFVDQGGWFVKTYTIAYSKDGEKWANYKEFGIAKVFQGNHDPDTVVTNMLKMAVNARYVRIKPQSWHNHIALRVEVYKGAASSKLTAGIHKLADTLTKTAKGKAFDKQVTSTLPTSESLNGTDNNGSMERKVSADDMVSYIDRQPSTEKLLDGDEASKKEELGVGVENDSAMSDDEQQADGYLVLREAAVEEKEAELKVLQKIKSIKKGEEPVGRKVSQGILAKRSLYENSQQSEAKAETKQNATPKVKKEDEQTKKKEVIVEKKEAEKEKRENKDEIPRIRKDSESYDPDKERQQLEKTEKIFQEYAKQLKNEGNAKEKKPSLVALNRLNFEDPGTVPKMKENLSYLAKSESLQKEKEELLKKLESLKKRVSVSKDRKIFFSLSTSRSKATENADTEYQESQLELAKTKKRLLEIENETKNLKVMELRYQKTPDKNVSPAKTLVRKNSRECKLGPANVVAPKVESTPASNPEREVAQKGNVLSQIKAFEQMKKTSEK